MERPEVGGERGDVAAVASFDRFAQEARASLVRLGWALVGDVQFAEDFAHEALVALLPVWDSVHDPGAYCRSVVVNRVRTRWRRRGREQSALSRLTVRRPVVLPVPSHEVWAAVRRLPLRQRVAVVLVVLDDQPVAAVAEHLGCEVETARTHLRRGKQRLAVLLSHLQEDQT